VPDNQRPKLDISTRYINLGLGKSGFTYDTTVTIRAINDSIRIDSIYNYDNKLTFELDNIQFPYQLGKGDSMLIKIKYPYKSDVSEYTSFYIVSNACDQVSVDFSIYNEIEPPPTARNGFGNIAILTEVNNLSNFDFKGYNFGAGIQLYVLKNVAFRLGFGFLEENESSVLTDRSKIINEINYYSANLKFNIAVNKNILGYFAPFVMYESGTENIEYHDNFARAYDLKSYAAGISIGGEFFIYHNFSISLESLIGIKQTNRKNILGFEELNEFPISESFSYFIKPKLNFIISYFIN
jgi:hypothetical protein